MISAQEARLMTEESKTVPELLKHIERGIKKAAQNGQRSFESFTRKTKFPSVIVQELSRLGYTITRDYDVFDGRYKLTVHW